MNYTLRSGFIEPEKTERGYKILASTTTVISGDRVFEIETGISIDLPKDYIGYLVHNKTRDIIVTNIVNSSDEIILNLKNLGRSAYSFNRGDELAELIFIKVQPDTLTKVIHL